MRKLILNSIKVNIILLGLYPILPHIINVITTTAFTILSALLFIFSKSSLLKRSKILLVNSSLYITFLISLLYTINFEYATKHLLTSLSLLALPVAFYFLNSSNFFGKYNIKDVLIKVFWGASAVYALFIYGTFFTFSNVRYPFKDANFFRKASSSIPLIDQHPIYSSIILGLAILIGVHYLFTEKSRKIKIYIAVGQIGMLVLIFTLMSKGVILALIISALTFLFFNLKKLKPVTILYIILPIFVVSGLIYVVIPQENNRFSQIFNQSTYNILNKNNSTSIRASIYICAWSKIKTAPFLGYGYGDVKDELLDCYASKNPFMVKERYNSHNQYLSVWLATGVFGLIIFCYFLFYNLRLSFKTDDYLGFSILLFFVWVLFFENILERQTGVILFSLFLNIFGIYNTNRLKLL